VIFGRVPVLGDENCHGLVRRGKGKRKREGRKIKNRETRKERKKEAKGQ